MLAEMREQRPFLTELRHACQHIEPEIAPVELAFAEIAPFDDRDRPGVPPVFWRLLHRHRVAVDEIERKSVRRGAIKLVRLVQPQIPRATLPTLAAAFGAIVSQQLNPPYAA